MGLHLGKVTSSKKSEMCVGLVEAADYLDLSFAYNIEC